VLILSTGDEESSHATGDGQSLPGYALERRGEEGGEVGKGGGWRLRFPPLVASLGERNNSDGLSSKHKQCSAFASISRHY
jgi:hypothetical protein